MGIPLVPSTASRNQNWSSGYIDTYPVISADNILAWKHININALAKKKAIIITAKSFLSILSVSVFFFVPILQSYMYNIIFIHENIYATIIETLGAWKSNVIKYNVSVTVYPIAYEKNRWDNLLLKSTCVNLRTVLPVR